MNHQESSKPKLSIPVGLGPHAAAEWDTLRVRGELESLVASVFHMLEASFKGV